MSNQTIKKRIEKLEDKSPSDEIKVTHIYLTAPNNEVEPVLYWVHPDYKDVPHVPPKWENQDG